MCPLRGLWQKGGRHLQLGIKVFSGCQGHHNRPALWEKKKTQPHTIQRLRIIFLEVESLRLVYTAKNKGQNSFESLILNYIQSSVP